MVSWHEKRSDFMNPDVAVFTGISFSTVVLNLGASFIKKTYI